MADLATIAQNKSLNNAVSDAARNIGSGANGPLPVEMPMSNQNMINEIQNGTNGEVPTAIQNPVGFDVLNK